MSETEEATGYPGQVHDSTWRSLVFPDGHVNPPAKARYHLIVVGAGPAGLVCALGAAGLGARVALVERQAMGGDCLNVGCVPSKALLEHTRRHPRGASFDSAFTWMRKVRAGIAAHDSVQRYTEHGVDVFLGEARFADGSTVEVCDQRLSGRRIVIATGARAALPEIPGLREADPLTNESIFSLERAPESLAIIGAGPIGCELAQALVRLSVRIDLFDAAERVLPAETPRASAAVAEALAREGVALRLGAGITRVRREGDGVEVEADGASVRAQRVLVAAGRRANVEALDLANAGVELTSEGLVGVDARLRTSNPRIYAAGDVCSRLQFTHHADAQARIVIQNALFAPTARTSKLVIPHCTYTTPEVAQVGRSRDALQRDNIGFAAYAVTIADLDRGRAAGDEDSFAELLVEPGRGNLLGATVVAENAGELIVPVCVAMSNGLRLGDLGKTVLPYPTRSEYLRRVADEFDRSRLTRLVRRAVAAWLRLTGR